MKRLSALCAAGLAAITLAGCGSSGTHDSSASSSVCPSGQLTFGVEPYEDAAKLTPAYQTLAKALGDKLGCAVKVQIVDSYVGEILAMKNGKLDLGEFGPLGFVFAQRQAGAVPVASFADKDGRLSSYTAGIWVPKGSTIKDIKGLAGHALALSEAGSTSGDALPRQQLKNAGITNKIKVEYAGGHPEAMLALTHGKVDAAEINSQTLASAGTSFDRSKYTQIWQSSPIANDPVTVAPTIKPAARAKIQQALLSLPTSAVAEIGKYLEFTPGKSAMVAVTNETYKPLFDLADSLGLTSKNL